MKKIILFLAVVLVFLSACSPTVSDSSDCVLMQHSETGEIDCFGCSSVSTGDLSKGVCRDPVMEMKMIENPDYECIATSDGCTARKI